ncbi:MAG: 50S ribosomal protein L4 [Clostridia bacterium]|nr:50S ribosomal protein L4 [Clostridia bacterium]
MPSLKIVDMTGKEVGTIELSDAVFAAEPNQAVLHAAVRGYLLNQRQGTQSTKTRSEVSGGGKKPWRQKGSGRARQGSTRSPQWTHGGIALGPKPRSYRVDMNKKTRRVAIISALSAKVAANEIIVVDKITTEDYKTKTMVNMLAAVGAGKKSLVVLSENDKRVVKSFDNIPGVKTTPSTIISVYDLINCDTVVADQNAIKTIEEVYA